MPTDRTEALVARLLEHALGLPQAWLDHPWGEDVAKVGKKVFVFFGTGDLPRSEFGFAVKLPESGEEARLLPFVQPSTYGLGKHGWVTVGLDATSAGFEDLFRRWIVESFRAVAPKRVAAELDAAAAAPAGAGEQAAPRRKTATRKKAAARKRGAARKKASGR